MPQGDSGEETKDVDFGEKSLLTSALPTRKGLVYVMSHRQQSLFSMAFRSSSDQVCF